MPTCTHVIESAAAAGQDITDTITLDETDRRRRRVLLKSDGGVEFLLDLPAVRLLRDGDLLALDDGRLVRVAAAGEALYEVRGSDAHRLLRLVWHIGNRHLPTEIRDDHVRIRADPVIRTMLLQLGARVTDVQAGFDPEGGAYEGAAAHRHDDGRGHENGHETVHEHQHGVEPGHDAAAAPSSASPPPAPPRRAPSGKRTPAKRL